MKNYWKHNGKDQEKSKRKADISAFTDTKNRIGMKTMAKKENLVLL